MLNSFLQRRHERKNNAATQRTSGAWSATWSAMGHLRGTHSRSNSTGKTQNRCADSKPESGLARRQKGSQPALIWWPLAQESADARSAGSKWSRQAEPGGSLESSPPAVGLQCPGVCEHTPLRIQTNLPPKSCFHRCRTPWTQGQQKVA